MIAQAAEVTVPAKLILPSAAWATLANVEPASSARAISFLFMTLILVEFGCARLIRDT